MFLCCPCHLMVQFYHPLLELMKESSGALGSFIFLQRPHFSSLLGKTLHPCLGSAWLRFSRALAMVLCVDYTQAPVGPDATESQTLYSPEAHFCFPHLLIRLRLTLGGLAHFLGVAGFWYFSSHTLIRTSSFSNSYTHTFTDRG